MQETHYSYHYYIEEKKADHLALRQTEIKTKDVYWLRREEIISWMCDNLRAMSGVARIKFLIK